MGKKITSIPTLGQMINAYYKRIYGKVVLNYTNVAEINKVTFSAPIFDVDANIILTDGTVSTHKSEFMITGSTDEDDDKDDEIYLISSVKISKANWAALISIRLDENQEIYVEINVSIVDGDYESIKDELVNTMIRL